MTDAAGSESWAYDSMGREVAEQRVTNGISKSTAYTHNLDGSLATLTYPSGRIISYSYDLVARPLAAIDTVNSINFAVSAAYAPTGSLSSLTNGANLTSTLYYNKRMQPCRISVKSSGTAPTSCTDSVDIGNVLDFTFNFGLGTDDNGNVVGLTNNVDATRSENFTYDQVNRLVTAETASTHATSPNNCWGETYTYDQWANLTTIGAVSTAYTGCTQESLSVTALSNNQLSATGFSYDASGNMLNDGRNVYAFNAESQIKSAAGVTYTYDGDGNRIQKSNGKIYWYGAGSEILDESDLNGNITDEYTFFAGQRVARRDASGNIVYYAADHLGTSRVVTSSAGAILDQSDFYPFGGERVLSSSSGNTYKFTGKERDTETTNDDYGARYYSSALGRFLSTDWSAIPAPVPYANLTNPQTLNLYAMVGDNPESFADLDGHEAQSTLPNFGGFLDGTVDPALFYANFCDKNPGDCPAEEQDLITQQQQGQNATVAATTATTSEATATEATMQQVDAAVKPLIESAAEEAGVAIGVLSKLFGAAVGVVIELATAPATARDEDLLAKVKEPKKDSAKPAAASGGSGKSGKGGLPPDAVKLKGGQGYRDKNGNLWKRDQLHKDHWDVSDRKGNKIKEVTFDGRQIWPDGPKNNQ
ncbi:MAG: RHS repeat-associated core domain-containing protein [Candidatus Acidiferrum sp.]